MRNFLDGKWHYILLPMLLISIIGHLCVRITVAEARVNTLTPKVASLSSENRKLKDELSQLKRNALVAQTQKNQDFLTREILPRTRKYNLPDSLVAGQWAIESGRATSSPLNCFFGIGPGWKFNTLDDCIKTYNNTLRNIVGKKGYNLDLLSSYQILVALQKGNTRYEGHSSRPLEYVDIVSNTPEFKYYASIEKLALK